MKKLYLYLFLSLLWCNFSFAEKIDSLFGIKLGDVIDKSIIIERVNRVPLDFIGHYNDHKKDYNYPKNFDLSVFHIYKVEPPKKNSMFNNYFVKVYPLSERVYDIYAYRNTWNWEYDSEEYRDKIIKESSDLFDALKYYYSKKTGSDFWWGNEVPLTASVEGYWYKKLKNSILYISKPEGSMTWGSKSVYRIAGEKNKVFELAISLRTKRIKAKEFIKAGATKAKEKKKETEKSHEQILDKTGL